MQKGQTGTLFLIIGLLIGFILAGAGILLYTNYSKNQLQSESTNPVSISQTETPQPTPSPAGEITNWKTYTNENLGFQIKYPQKLKLNEDNWVYQENKSNDGSIIGVNFGTPYDQPGGGKWGVSVYSVGDVDNLIKQEGSQFQDRKETRQDVMVDSRKGILAIVTTNDFKDWLGKGVYIEDRGKVYVIGTSGHEPEFDAFYQSFKFLK